MDPDQLIPLYAQLKSRILEDIVDGRYGADGRLPTEFELCRIYGLSRTPVSRALAELAEEGVLLRHRRRGTFVNPEWRPPRPAGDRALHVMIPGGAWEELFRRAVPEGARLTVTTVEVTQLRASLVRAVAEGRAPDLGLLDSVWVPEFASSGYLQPLVDLDREWVTDDYGRDFLPTFNSLTEVDGQLLAVPAEANVAGLWYRRSLLEEAGLESLRTWGDLVTFGDAVAAHVATPIVMPGGTKAGEAASYCALAFLASNGVSVIHNDLVTLHSTATVAALEFLRDLVRRHLLPEESVAYDRDRAIRRLGQGEAALCFGGSYQAPVLAAAGGLSVEGVWDRFGFTGMPSGPRGGAPSLAGATVHAIFRQARNPQLAMEMLKRLVSDKELVAMSRAIGQLPLRRTAFPVLAAESPFHATSLELLGDAIVRPPAAAYARVSTQVQTMLESTLTGRLAPAEASRRAADMIGAITGLPVDR
jgi:ABC-type glycerol-3-phosphate transport system substrate-binding protein